MGCGASKYSSALDQKLKGTTLIGFVYRGGIILGAESRSSNEHDVLLYPLRIRDNKTKMNRISTTSNIMYVVQGVEGDCHDMIAYMKQKFPDVGNAPPSVSSVVKTMYNYQNSLVDEGKACGAIIAGWDASGAPEVHRVFLKKNSKMVVKEQASFPAALGSGQSFALKILEDGYSYNMTTEAAIDLAFKALFTATYYDKHSGGELKVYHLANQESEWNELPVMNASEAYTNFYDLHDRYERQTLFMVVDAGIEPPISANDLVEHFKPVAALLVSHRVAYYKLGKAHFYFHRLVFESEDDARKAYKTTTRHGRTTPSCLQHFPAQVILNNKNPSVTVYVNWSSSDLRKFLHEDCQLLYSSKK